MKLQDELNDFSSKQRIYRNQLLRESRARLAKTISDKKYFCADCGREYSGKESRLDEELFCPECKTRLQNISAGRDHQAKAEKPILEQPPVSSSIKTGTKKCPFCAEEIKTEAIKCRYCGEFLTDAKPVRKDENDYYAPSPKDSKPAPENINQSAKFLGGTHHPWRRFFARTFDLSTLGLVNLFVITFIVTRLFPSRAPFFVEGLENPFIASIFFVGFWIPIETIFITTLGYTPGKALFGISVKSSNGNVLSSNQSLERSFRVAIQGLGLGIPLVALFTQLFAYRRLTKTGTTSWDSATNCIVTHEIWGPARSIVCTVTMFVLFAVLSLANTILA